jgi:hypothetical protein
VMSATGTMPRRAWAEGGAVFLTSALAVTSLAAAKGGYFWSSWSWASLAFAAVTAVALLMRRLTRLGRPSAAFFGLFLAFAAWSLLSLAWSPSGAPVFEAERTLVYVTAVAAVLVTVRRQTVPLLLGGVLCGLALIDLYALGTRLLPDRLASNDPLAADRLATPIGYWNGLGAATVVAALLALGFAIRGRTVVARATAALVLPVLLSTLYFTFSRGSWIALGFALLVLIIVDSRRLQLVTVSAFVLVPTALALVLAWRSPALGRAGGAAAAAAHDGHRLALWVALLGVAGAFIAALAFYVEPRVSAPSVVRRVYGASLAAGAIVALVVALVLAGGPGKVVRHGWHSFSGSGVKVGAGQQENKRLFSLSNNNRIELWRGAWQESKAHPVLGGGAGSYESWWLAHRKSTQQVRDAHSLYLQTLAETGAIGLALLALALVVPIAVAFRVRRRPLVPFALGAYAAYLVHAAGDWDWQLPGVTLPAVLVGAALVVSARGDESVPARGLFRPVAAVAASVAVVVAFLMVLGNVPLTRASSAADRGQWRISAAEAKKAQRWLPWAAEPWRFLGEAQLALRNRPAARGALETALGKDPKSWQLWFDLSAATKGKASARALKRAAELNPLSPEIEQLRQFPG